MGLASGETPISVRKFGTHSGTSAGTPALQRSGKILSSRCLRHWLAVPPFQLPTVHAFLMGQARQDGRCEEMDAAATARQDYRTEDYRTEGGEGQAQNMALPAARRKKNIIPAARSRAAAPSVRRQRWISFSWGCCQSLWESLGYAKRIRRRQGRRGVVGTGGGEARPLPPQRRARGTVGSAVCQVPSKICLPCVQLGKHCVHRIIQECLLTMCYNSQLVCLEADVVDSKRKLPGI